MTEPMFDFTQATYIIPENTMDAVITVELVFLPGFADTLGQTVEISITTTDGGTATGNTYSSKKKTAMSHKIGIGLLIRSIVFWPNEGLLRVVLEQ